MINTDFFGLQLEALFLNLVYFRVNRLLVKHLHNIGAWESLRYDLTSDYLLSENFLRDEKGSRFILLHIASISHWKSLRYADFLLRRILKEDPSDLDGYQVFSVSDLEHFIHP